MTSQKIPSRASSFADDDESLRFMEKYESPPQDTRHGLIRIFTTTRIYVFALHLSIIALLCVLWSDHRGHSHSFISTAGRSWSPVHPFIEYEINDETMKDGLPPSNYSGPPTDENNAAWEALIEPIYFSATREELEKAGESLDNIAELAEGGYPAAISVYHELHCLRQIRFWLYRDHYYPNTTERQEQYVHTHIDHCIETLRLASMCHGSSSLQTFYWKNPTDEQPKPQTFAKSVCVKWDSIHSWAYSRKVSTTPKILRQASEEE